jgi:hypothetical protein
MWQADKSAGPILLRRLNAGGILARDRDEAMAGGPYVCRVAAKVLQHLLGFATVEALRSSIP